MTKYRFMHAGALAALALALGLGALPAQAQEGGGHGMRGGGGERGMRQAEQPRPGGWIRSEARPGGGHNGPGAGAPQAPQGGGYRGDWGGGARERWEGPVGRDDNRAGRAEAPVGAAAHIRNGGYGADRNATYSAPRDRSYGATTRSRDWAGDRRYDNRWGQNQGGYDIRGQNQGQWGRDQGRWGQNQGRWGQSQGHWGQNQGRWGQNQGRYDTRGQSQGHWGQNQGRWGQNQGRWDNRSWRSDNRYDWYRYRASNRSLFSLGRYYAPYRGYSYSRVGIGVRLGSPFYANRYWINDPWRYRLPEVYGPYRWVRYYDDALLVDVYSGEVVDVINDFFW